MKVVVAGATGKQGKGALWYLSKQNDISQILIGGRAINELDELVVKLKDSRLVATFLDLADIRGSAEVFRGADVVVNCAYEGYRTDDNYTNLELTATKAALEGGVNYVGVGGAPSAHEQLALDDEFKRKGLLAILGMGELTGLVQVMAAYAINRLNLTERVEMKYGERDLTPPEERSRPLAWGPRPGKKGKTDLAYVGLGATRFRYNAESLFWENGKLHYSPPRANPEIFVFKEPIGAVTIAQTPGAATVSLSRSFPEIKHISLKSGGDPDFERKITFLRDLGFFNNKSIDVQGQKISPWEVLNALLAELPLEAQPPNICSETRVIVKGVESGKEVQYTISMTRISHRGTEKERVPLSGLCAAITAMMMVKGRIKGKGVLMPEVCVSPELFLDELARAGTEDIEITKKVRL